MVMRCCLCVLLILSGNALAGLLQVESRTMAWHPTRDKDIESRPPHASNWAEGSIKMPYTSSDTPGVAARINDVLYITLLEMPAPVKPGKTFMVTKDKIPLGTASLNFEVLRNDARILALQIVGEGCGAYCEEYTRAYNFDARTGRALRAGDIFTPSGSKKVVTLMYQERNHQYTDEISRLKQQQRKEQREQTQASKKIETGFEDMIAFNEGCRNRSADERAAPDILDNFRFSIRSGDVIFSSERCSNHALRAIDSVGEVNLKILNMALAPLLTDYGKTLLLRQGNAPMPRSPFGQVLYGKIGDAAIAVRFDQRDADGAFVGTYYYAKHRKLISLQGTQKDAVIEMVENIEGGIEGDSAKFTLHRSGSGFSGQWQGKNKQLPVVLDW